MQHFKHWMLAAALLLSCATQVCAQINLVGRTYYNANIMEAEMQNMMKDVEKKMDEAKKSAVAKAEKKRGRELTDAEKEEIDKQLEDARKQLVAIKKGMKTTITVNFKTETNAVVKADMRISEDAMKAAGIGWAKRKLMKAAMAIAPSTNKCTYVVQGNIIIFDEKNDPDTMRISDDGKQLFGKFDKKTNFVLTLME